MSRFLTLLNRKLTLGNLLTIFFSFIFAIVLRQLFVYLFEFFPVKGELDLSDISFLGIIMFFRFIVRVYFEYLLNDKYSIPLSEIKLGIQVPISSTMDTPPKAPENSPKPSTSSPEKASASGDENSTTASYREIKQHIKHRIDTDPSFRKEVESNRQFLANKFQVDEKMWNVLSEIDNKISKLLSIKSQRDVKFYQEHGALDISVPSNMTDTEAEKISKEVGALDRSIQNKFSEYRNLSSVDARLYDSVLSNQNKGMLDANIKNYEALFSKNNK